MNVLWSAALVLVSSSLGIFTAVLQKGRLSQKYPANWTRPEPLFLTFLDLRAWGLGIIAVLVFLSLVKILVPGINLNVFLSTLIISLLAPIAVILAFGLWLFTIAPGLNWLNTSGSTAQSFTSLFLAVIVVVIVWILISILIANLPNFLLPRTTYMMILLFGSAMLLASFFAVTDSSFENLDQATQHKRGIQFFGETYRVAHQTLLDCDALKAYVANPQDLRPYVYWSNWRTDDAPMTLQYIDNEQKGKYVFLQGIEGAESYISLTVTSSLKNLLKTTNTKISPVTISTIPNENGGGKVILCP